MLTKPVPTFRASPFKIAVSWTTLVCAVTPNHDILQVSGPSHLPFQGWKQTSDTTAAVHGCSAGPRGAAITLGHPAPLWSRPPRQCCLLSGLPAGLGVVLHPADQRSICGQAGPSGECCILAWSVWLTLGWSICEPRLCWSVVSALFLTCEESVSRLTLCL